jgi:hypothetical protein
MFDKSNFSKEMLNKKNIGKTEPIISLKDKIIDFLKEKGPSTPVQVSQGVGRESIFVSAVLYELSQSKTILKTHAKIGGSRVYYMGGQEEKLSILSDYFSPVEKESFEYLKKLEVIYENKATPAMRVALSQMKDFAIENEINGKKFWRWYLSKKEPMDNLSKTTLNSAPELANNVKPQIKKKSLMEKTRKKVEIEDELSIKTESFFSENNIEIISKELIRKNSENNYTIKINSQLGKIEIFACSKSKKRVSDQDVILAHQKGKNKNMLTLLLINGELTKKAQEYINKNIKGYILVKRL